MIVHYIKIALRNLKKYKMQTAISVVSMAVGVVLFAAIHSLLLVVLEESSLEQNPNYNQVHWVQGEICDHPVFQQKMRNREFKSIADYCYIPSMQWMQDVHLEIDDEQKSFMQAVVMGVKQHTLDFYHFVSPVTGKPLKEMDDNSVIVSESFAMRAYGTLNVIGQQVRLYTCSYEWNGNHMGVVPTQEKSLAIADVLHTNISDEFSRADIYFKVNEEEYCSSYKLLLIPSEDCQYQQICDDIMPIAQELMGENHGTSVGYTPWSFHSYENGEQSQPDMYITVKSILYTVVGLILLAAFLGYIRMQIQLFWLRQREIALRTVVGGQIYSLFGMFFTEIFVVMLMTCGAAIVISRILRDQLYESVTVIMRSNGMLWTMQDFEQHSLVIIVALMVLSLFLVMLAVYQIRRSQTGLALQMKPKSNSAMRKIALGLQMVLSTVFIAVSLLIYEQIKEDSDEVGYSVETYNNSFVMQRCATSVEQLQEKIGRMKAIDGVDGVASFYTSYMQLPEDDRPDFMNQPYFRCYYQENDELTDFLKMEITPVPCSAERENTVYVSEKLYKAMTQDGTRPAPALKMEERLYVEGVANVTYFDCYVSGTFKKIPGEMSDYIDYVIWNKPVNWGEPFLVKAKEGMEKHVYAQLTELRNEGLEEVPLDPIVTMEQMQDRSSGLTRAMVYIVFILTVINIIGTCSSLYSAVSLDVRRRRKEVALRKINGAVAGDIMKIFAKEYVIMIVICIIVALPLSIIAFMAGNRGIILEQGNVVFVGWFAWCYLKVALIVVIVTAVTVGGKIWGIMKLKPVEGLKE